MYKGLVTVDGHEIGRRIERLLQESSYSKEDLARKVGVSLTTIYNWISETNPTIPEIQHLCDLSIIFDVSLDYIVKGTDDH